ncbi:MAG: sugar transferase [Halioglobus sp.]|nr:sugar transferase [Halioglobus sp.]
MTLPAFPIDRCSGAASRDKKRKFVTQALRFRIWQRAQQAIAAALLVVLSPLIALLMLLVKLDSRGPFLYSQQRPGLRGSIFKAYKIRSMYVGADEDPKLAYAVTSRTPEVTRIGRVLRDLKLDELPQLWSILRGDMAFVGPRPIAIGLHEYLVDRIPDFSRRLSVRPGLSNLGQICIDENAATENLLQDWLVRFEGERHYLKHRSINYDIVIIGMTIAYCLRKLWRAGKRANQLPRRSAGAVSVIAVILLAGCAQTLPDTGFESSTYGQSRAIPAPEGKEPTPIINYENVTVDTLTYSKADPVYRLGSRDRLAINVFGEPGMDHLLVSLDGSGQIQLPIIETVDASGLSLSELQFLLKEEYGKHFLNPWVVVELDNAQSRPLYLLGEFNQPGIVHMTSDMSLIQALGAGHGLSDRAYTRGARLIRDESVVAVDIDALLNQGRMDQNVGLEPYDTLFVPGLDDLRIFVLGAVVQPGAKDITNGALTLVDAVSRSGGPLRGEANLEQVRVIRTHSPVSGELFVVDFTRIIDGIALDMELQPGDIVYLPVNGMGGWNDVIAAISPTILTISRALDPFVLAKALSED